MGDPTGFLKVQRKVAGYRPVEERINDYSEVEMMLSEDERKLQASRCMDCGVPFCHWACPVGNIMPEWQDRIFHGDWKAAWEMLQETNNFPEITGRVCPALCEASCVLGLNDEAVTIRQNELAVIERAFAEGYVKANPPKTRTGKKVAVIGGGPAGMAAADMLNKMGHSVTVFEGQNKIGGYLRYGIPDFKLDKSFIDRRLEVLKAEGIEFKTNTYVGKDIDAKKIKADFDAVLITIGAREARDLKVEGRELKGIHQSLDFLTQQNRSCGGDLFCGEEMIAAIRKNVVVIGGGDTGSDCVGTSNRQGASKVTQLEVLPMPASHRTAAEPWPLWPKLHKTSSSHEEGCDRQWCVTTKKFIGENGHVKKVLAAKVEWKKDDQGRYSMVEVPGSDFEIEADLVLLAMGFVHVVQEGLVADLGLKLDARGNIETSSDFATSDAKVFAAGDANRGASLVVYAIAEGRGAAEAINKALASK